MRSVEKRQQARKADSRNRRTSLIWLRTETLGKLTPGPGPASVHSACEIRGLFSQADGCIATVPPRWHTQQGGVAVSRLDGRGFSHCDRRSADSAPTSRHRHQRSFQSPRTLRLASSVSRSPLPGLPHGLGPVHRISRDSLPAVRCTTCGDSNPTCLLWSFFSPLVAGGLTFNGFHC